MGPKTTDPKDLLIGGLLQCCEAASVGMPFEVQYITSKLSINTYIITKIIFLGMEDSYGYQSQRRNSTVISCYI